MTASSSFPSASLAAQIARLPDLPWRELKAEYQRLFDNDPPVQHRRFAERRIAHRLQEVEYTKVDRNLLDRNRRRIDALVKTGKLPPRVRNPAPMPGMVLVRHYGGVEHHVTVVDEGAFQYQGKPYKSLSAIAREITGTRWSGPAFFGLRGASKLQGGGA